MEERDNSSEVVCEQKYLVIKGQYLIIRMVEGRKIMRYSKLTNTMLKIRDNMDEK